MKKSIFIDIDQTLNKLWETFVYYYNQIYHTTARLTRNDIVGYLLPEVLGVPKEKQMETLDTIFNIPGIWEEMPVYENAISIVKELNDLYSIYIATTPWPSNMDCCRGKLSWMNTYFPFIKKEQIIFIHNKSLLRGDILIDDSPQNLISFNGLTIAFDYPYNRNIRTDGRIIDWTNAPGIIENILKRIV